MNDFHTCGCVDCEEHFNLLKKQKHSSSNPDGNIHLISETKRVTAQHEFG